MATADDMGLGKTLTMIALMLTKKMEAKKEGEKKGEKKLDSWISKSGDPYLLSVNPSFLKKPSGATVIISKPFIIRLRIVHLGCVIACFAVQIPALCLLKALWSSVPPP